MAHGFRELLVWRQAMDLARDSYFLTQKMPKEERYGLSSQIRRAAISLPANIAEGNGRRTRRDYVSFLRVAQGEVRLVSQQQIAPILLQVESVVRLLNRLIQSLDPSIPQPLTP
jgi:hypothetical protein